MSDFKLSGIKIYPVKSLPGISLNSSVVEERGLKYDRRWMLVDAENMFFTQRLFPQMIFIDVKIENDKLIFAHKRKALEKLAVPMNDYLGKDIHVGVWDDTCLAKEYGKEINQWFEEVLKFKCKLVYMPDSSHRKTSTDYFPNSKNVSFADGYPFLIIGEESLNYLNAKLENPVSIDQFRPNLIFSGGSEHIEDEWEKIKIGALQFAVVKPCARCVITTIDLNSGNKNKEPLKTLSTYRNSDGKIMFGQNALALSEGIIEVGNKITML
jgi:uncharacterized protein YcbX